MNCAHNYAAFPLCRIGNSADRKKMLDTDV